MGSVQDEQEPGSLLSPGSCGVDVLDEPKGIKDGLCLLMMALEMLARAPSILVALRWSGASHFVLGGLRLGTLSLPWLRLWVLHKRSQWLPAPQYGQCSALASGLFLRRQQCRCFPRTRQGSNPSVELGTHGARCSGNGCLTGRRRRARAAAGRRLLPPPLSTCTSSFIIGLRQRY